MKRFYFLPLLLVAASALAQPELNLQVYYDFGSEKAKKGYQKEHCITTTFEFMIPDQWGSTYGYADLAYSLARHKNYLTTPPDCAMSAYWEITRNFNFWRNTKAAGMNLHFEYNGGLDIYDIDEVTYGKGVKHNFLFGPDYKFATKDGKNRFSTQLLLKIIVDDYNRYLKWESQGLMIPQKGNQVPLQFTFTWDCKDFCTLKGLSFRGYTDIWGQKLRLVDTETYTYTDPQKQSFVWVMEPQLWYSVGQWFNCPQLHVGTELELSYNLRAAAGFLFLPRLGLTWVF